MPEGAESSLCAATLQTDDTLDFSFGYVDADISEWTTGGEIP